MAKPMKTVSRKEVKYSENDWKRLKKLRNDTAEILESLEEFDVNGLAHGSVARGDVKEGSDIDIITLRPTASYKIELALEKSGFKKTKRKIVMATPWQLPKAHINLGKDRIVTFPLTEPKKLEEEFYRFGGSVNLDQVRREKRVSGVDKRLMLIEPTEEGHRESQVMGREGEVAKILGVSLDIVRERVQVLTRRDKIGRTGIFLERELAPRENFETIWKHIVERNPEVKRRFRG